MTIALALALMVSTYFVLAVSGMYVLKRLGLVTSAGTANAFNAPALVAAAVVNLAILLAALFEVLDLGTRLIDLRFSVSGKDLAFCALALSGTAVLAAFFARSKGATATPGNGIRSRDLALVLGTLFCGALMEEVLFRAIAIETLRPLGPLAAVGGSAAIFTLIHLPTSKVTLEAMLAWLMGGLALGMAWWMGAPLAAVTALHFARNVANILWIDPPRGPGRARRDRIPAPARLSYYLALSVGGVALAWPFYGLA